MIAHKIILKHTAMNTEADNISLAALICELKFLSIKSKAFSTELLINSRHMTAHHAPVKIIERVENIIITKTIASYLNDCSCLSA